MMRRCFKVNELYRLLIVDDEIILRNGVKYLCNWEEYGFVVVGEASNGKEALELIPVLDPHIVIIDIVMPIMNGIDFTKAVNEKYPNIKVLILSSFSEFDYVREAFKYGAVDYLLKPKLRSEDLLNSLNNIVKKFSSPQTRLNESQKNKLLLEQVLFTSLDDQEKVFNELQEGMKQSNFRLMKASLQYLRYVGEEELKKITEEVFSVLKTYSIIDLIKNNEYIVLINYSLDKEDELFSYLSQIQDTHNELFKEIKFIVSESFSDIRTIKDYYDSVNNLMGYLFYYSHEAFVKANGIYSESVEEFDAALLLTYLNSFEIEKVKIYLFDYLNKVRFKRSYDEYSFKRFIQSNIYNMFNTMRKLGFDVGILNQNKMKLFKSIDKSIDYNEIKSLIQSFLDQIENLVDVQSEKKNSIILDKIIDYVHKHYNEDLSLMEISEELHLNYYYLSSYFKNQTNENLTSYINNVRIQKAKQLLTDSDLNIAEVSKQVGFTDHNYFSKVFKKYTKMTPTSYRRKQGK